MNKEMNNAHFNRILVVDDTTANLLLLTDLLKEHGYIVHPASDGELALRFVQSILPDLILLDIRMPGMDGFEVCRRLKADERTRSIPIIFISILEDEGDKVKGFQAGGVDYITKPFQPEEVLARVRTHLRLGELAENLEQKVIERTEELMIANERLQREIADRKKVEEALQKSEALLNATQRLAKIGGWDWDVEHQTTFWTEETFRIHGFEPQPFVPGSSEYVERSLACYDPNDRPVVLAAFQRCVQQGEPYDLEFPFTSADGRRKWIRTTATAVHEDGRIVKVIGSIMDITDRKQADQALRLNAERMETLLQLNQLTDATIDEITSFAFDAAVRVTRSRLGYLAFMNEDETVLNMQLWSREAMAECKVPDKSRMYPVETTGLWGEAVRQRRPIITNDYNAANPWKKGTPEGHVRLTRHMNLPVIVGGRIVLVAGVGNKDEEYDEADLNQLTLLMDGMWRLIERKRTEHALRLSQFIIDNASIGITRGNGDGKILSANEYWARVLGYSQEELRTMSFFDIDPNLTPESWLEHRKRLTATGFNTFESVHRRKDGTTLPVEVTVNYLKFGDQVFSCSFTRDITERKRAEAEVERLKNYLANIIDSMPSVLVGMGLDETVTQWNRQAEEITGISAAEAVGRPITQLFPDFSPWIKAMRGEVKRRRPASMEKLLIEKEGERRFYDLMLYPIIANGAEGAVVRIEDATERARIQELMILTEKMMSLGGLAAGMAHEINNPLGIITQAAQNIERRVSPELPANRKAAEELGVSLEGIKAYFERRQIPEFIGSIREASLRASRIIANMLQFSRCAGTTMQLVSPAGIIEQALELAAGDYDLKKKFDFRSIEIIRDYARDVPEVPMVAVEMEQVMLNLLKNAAQSMILNPPDRRPRITLRLRREERYALIEVEDNGLGMGEEVRRRVFEPFFTTKEPGMGTGLGLSVSYMIVTQNHKGLMEAESKPGKGACFRIRLPLPKESIHE